ncbi:MAG: tetratricopeptide repeat protein [Niveispirillum sp.]|uniref:tetratricopeptide repeat protein n=1 Tax=Niveispirillum sp. TaxID=1917217 RepID=UPI0040352908
MDIITLGLLVKIAFALSVADDLADVKKKLWETTGEIAGAWLDRVLNRLPSTTRQAMKAAESQIKAHQTMLRLDESRQEVALTMAGRLLRDHAPSAADIVKAAYDAPTLTAQILGNGKAILAEIDGMEGENDAVQAVLTILLRHVLSQTDNLKATEALWRELIQKRQEDILAALRSLPDDLFLRSLAGLTLLRRNAPVPFRKDILSASELLTARHTNLSLRGRDGEMETLLSWATAPTPVRVRLLTGPGGHGKTRLALELCRRLEQQGWRTGFLVDRLPDLSNIRLADLFDETVPTLITIDYAAGRMGDLQRFADLAADWAASGRFRLLLVEREAGDWWTNRKSLPDPAGTLLRGPSCLAEPLEVPALPTGIPVDVFTEAASHFAPLLGVPVDQVQTPGIWPDDLGLPLFARARALLAVEAARDGTALLTTTQNGILDHLLSRERRVWRAAARLTADDNAKLDDICTIVTLLTLSDPTHRNDAPALVRRLPALANHSGETLKQWLTALHPLYGDGDLLRGLEPDLLGEHLVWRTITSAADPLLTTATGHEASEAQAQTALTILSRLAARKPEVVEWLRAILDRTFDRLAVPAFRVALEQPLPMAALFREVMGRLSAEHALKLARLLPEYTTELREIAALVEQRLVEVPLPADAPLEALLFKAGHLNNLSIRLSNLGQLELALAAVEEAVAIQRAIAQKQPDSFMPDLAMGLNTLSNCLSELGQRERALAAVEEAVVIRRALVKKRPDAVMHDLATSLNSLSNRLFDLGETGQASAAVTEAVTIRRVLAKRQPDTFMPLLASALNNMAIHLTSLRQPEEALAASEEAVTIYRPLADKQPDAFLPSLATSLNTLAIRLAELGQFDKALAKAEEAVVIYRALAEERPSAFMHELAMSLSNLSIHRSNLGQGRQALTAIEEAVAIYRALFKMRPDAFAHNLAASIAVRRNSLHKSERYDDALAAAREALALQFPMFVRLPAPFGQYTALFYRDYIDSAQSAGQEPDPALVDPIVAALIEHGFLPPPEAEPDAHSPT